MLTANIANLSKAVGKRIKEVNGKVKSLETLKADKTDLEANKVNIEKNSQEIAALKTTVSSSSADELKRYVQSRGTGLVTNGFGFLLNNTNFSRFTFNPAMAYAGLGSFFTSVASADNAIDEFIPVNPKSRYLLSFFARTSVKVGTPLSYFYIGCYDADGLAIGPETLSRVNFRLAAPLTAGGNVLIHQDDISKIQTFINVLGPRSSQARLVDGEYTTRTGYKIPSGTYSRTFLTNNPTVKTLRLEGNKLIGFTVQGGVNKPAGSLISVTLTDATYLYPMITGRSVFNANRNLVNHEIPETWTDYTLDFTLEKLLPELRPNVVGMDDKSLFPNMGDSMATATATIKFGWLLNRGSGVGNETSISAVQMREL